MSIGIKAVETLIPKNTIFKSPRIKDLTMINTKYFNKSNTSLTPDIESIKIQKGRDTVVEFSSKKFSNGNLFEVYRLNNEIIKVLKNRFGEIINFKSSISNNNNTPAHTYELAKDAINAKIRNFLG